MDPHHHKNKKKKKRKEEEDEEEEEEEEEREEDEAIITIIIRCIVKNIPLQLQHDGLHTLECIANITCNKSKMHPNVSQPNWHCTYVCC